MLNLLFYIFNAFKCIEFTHDTSESLWRGCFYEGQPVYLLQYCQYLIAATISSQRQ